MTAEIEMSNSTLDILERVEYDHSIESIHYSDYTPQSQNNLNILGSPITIEINASDNYILPSDSFLYIKGQLVKADGNVYDAATEVALVNNAMMFLFSDIRYSIGNMSVETINNPGQATTILSYLSQPDDFNTSSGLNMCWCKDTTNNANSKKYNALPAVAANLVNFVPTESGDYNQGFAVRKGHIMDADPRGSFSFVIPFKHMFGFGDYNKVMFNLKHVLTLTRITSDNLAIHHAANVDNGKIVLSNITWKVPHVKPEAVRLFNLRSIIESKQSIPVAFSARTCESTMVTQTRIFPWKLNTTSGVEKPRWIIVGFQTDKNTTQEQNPAIFNHVNLVNAYVSINAGRYPMYDINSDFVTNDYSILYEMFDRFKQEFYGFNSLVGGTQVNVSAFKNLFPIIVFDIRHQNDETKTSRADMELHFRFSENVPANTMAYAVILSDRMYKLESDGKNLVMLSS
jgi:hypothetical protein